MIEVEPTREPIRVLVGERGALPHLGWRAIEPAARCVTIQRTAEQRVEHELAAVGEIVAQHHQADVGVDVDRLRRVHR